MRHNKIIKLGIGVVFGALAAMAQAQVFPSKPFKLVVPYAPGSGVDVVARPLADALSRQIGQSVIVENRTGASGTIATAYVAASSPDGYTMLIDTSSHTSAPLFIPKLPYDVLRDFTHVTTLTESPVVLVVSKASGLNTLADLIAAAKAKPGELTYGSAGAGSQAFMSAEQMRSAAGFQALHVPFKSSVDAMVEVLAGRITFTFTGVAAAVPLIKDGRLTALAVGASKRSVALPDVPTVEEAGVHNGTYIGWLGLMVPAKTPKAVVDRLHDEFVQILGRPDVKKKLADVGSEPWTMKTDEFEAMAARELKQNEKLVKTIGLKSQ